MHLRFGSFWLPFEQFQLVEKFWSEKISIKKISIEKNIFNQPQVDNGQEILVAFYIDQDYQFQIFQWRHLASILHRLEHIALLLMDLASYYRIFCNLFSQVLGCLKHPFEQFLIVVGCFYIWSRIQSHAEDEEHFLF